MDISVTRFRAQCLELIRQVKSGGGAAMHPRPWERLRGSGELAMEPEESVLDAGSFAECGDSAIQASCVIPIWEGFA